MEIEKNYMNVSTKQNVKWVVQLAHLQAYSWLYSLIHIAISIDLTKNVNYIIILTLFDF